MAYTVQSTTGGKPLKLGLPPVSTIAQAQAQALDAYARLGIPVGIYDASLVLVDGVDAWSYAQGMTEAQYAASHDADAVTEPTEFYGPETADDDYTLTVTTDGFASVLPVTPPDGSTDQGEVPPGPWMFRGSEAVDFDEPLANTRWISGASPGDIVEAQDVDAETPTLATIVPIDAYAYPPPFVKSFATIPAIGPGYAAQDIDEWRQNAIDWVRAGNPVDGAYPFTLSDKGTDTGTIVPTQAAGLFIETQLGGPASGSDDFHPLTRADYPPQFGHIDADASADYNPWAYDPAVFNSPLIIDPNDSSLLRPNGSSVRVKYATVQIARPFTPLQDDDGHSPGYFFRCCLVGWSKASRTVSTTISGRGGLYNEVRTFRPTNLRGYKMRVQPGYNRLPMYHFGMETDPDAFPGPDAYIGPLTGTWDGYAGEQDTLSANGTGDIIRQTGHYPGPSPYTCYYHTVDSFGVNGSAISTVEAEVLDARVDWRRWEMRVHVRAVYVRRELDGTETEYTSRVAQTAFLRVLDGVRPPMHANHRPDAAQIVYGPKPTPTPPPVEEYTKGTIQLYVITRGEKKTFPPADTTPGGNSLGPADLLTLTSPPIKDLAYAAYGWSDLFTAPGTTIPAPSPSGLRVLGYTSSDPQDAFPVFGHGPVLAYLDSDSSYDNPAIAPTVPTVPVIAEPGTKIGEFKDRDGNTVQVFDRPPEKAH